MNMLVGFAIGFSIGLLPATYYYLDSKGKDKELMLQRRLAKHWKNIANIYGSWALEIYERK